MKNGIFLFHIYIYYICNIYIYCDTCFDVLRTYHCGSRYGYIYDLCLSLSLPISVSACLSRSLSVSASLCLCVSLSLASLKLIPFKCYIACSEAMPYCKYLGLSLFITLSIPDGIQMYKLKC